MNEPTALSFNQWYCMGEQAAYVRTSKSPGGILDLLEVVRPAGDMSRPALPEIVLYEDLLGGSRVVGNLGGGRFDLRSEKGGLTLAAPNFATAAVMEQSHQLRSLAFSMDKWKGVLDEATEGRFSFDNSFLYGRVFDSPAIRAALRKLWALSEEEGAPSRLLAQAAGCEILAELCRIGGAQFTPAKGGLAPWAKRHCQEFMRARLSQDISLDELAAEAQLSPYHFARMFKQSFGVPPRIYFTQLRMEKACELLALTNLTLTEIAFNVGYSSSQVLARVFFKHQQLSPSDYRRAVRGQSGFVPGALK
ncbi:helix-turn-helix domain-containing protein [Rheinheimera nanhaiensis]|uniref:Transcriptional regulatory protein n=1 Tax=Rheinheimera nanhaiensis E407-8 TaxID=562729 RepID=I1DVB1_9GAMM|nr:AraC family transcriptional regulator [Rheinheimera nanhaiensis]GAB57989.1 transcriptional regulatory protein [Rheinheimera nanhaiensis E407-8]